MFKVEKGVPMPRSRAPNVKYPFREMEAGDSFVIPKTQARTGLYVCAAKVGIKIAVRSQPDNTYRVWRVAKTTNPRRQQKG